MYLGRYVEMSSTYLFPVTFCFVCVNYSTVHKHTDYQDFTFRSNQKLIVYRISIELDIFSAYNGYI